MFDPAERPMLPETTSIVLSGEGLRRISQDRMPKDFTFIVNGTHYLWNSLLAEYLSPRVAEIRNSDPTCCEFVIEVDETDEERLQSTFKSLLNLSVGVVATASLENRSLVMDLAFQLGNMEILEKLDYEELSFANLHEIVSFKCRYSLDCSKEIEFMAENFFVLGLDFFADFGSHLLSDVLASNSLVLYTEDSLYTFIKSLLEKNPEEYVGFLRFIEYEALSVESMQDCFELIGNLIQDGFSIDNTLWDKLRTRLCHNCEYEPKKGRYVR